MVLMMHQEWIVSKPKTKHSKLDGALRFELTNATKTSTDDDLSHDEWLSLPFVLSFLGFSRF
jgi:hypothetical protein